MKLINNNIYKHLPSVLKDLCSKFDGKEKDTILMSALTVLSAALPNVFGIYDNKKVYPNLYTMIVAPPASGKGVMNFCKGLIEPINESILQRSEEIRKKCLDDENQDNKTCPRVKRIIIPANVSSAQFYRHLTDADDSVIIIESEADTLSNMLKNDWSNISDLLRKAGHHETASISRKNGDFFTIKEPKLSLLLSGTPGQIQPLVDSVENGLYSRFMFYTFSGSKKFKRVFESKGSGDVAFRIAGEKIIKPLYNTLLKRKTPLEIVISVDKKEVFYEKMQSLLDVINEKMPVEFVSNLYRHGLFFYRICMILTILRNMDKVDSTDKLECSEIDFKISLHLILVSLEHTSLVFNHLKKKGSSSNNDILSKLSNEFTTGDVLEIVEGQKLSKRTAYSRIESYRRQGLIEKTKNGKYRKLDN